MNINVLNVLMSIPIVKKSIKVFFSHTIICNMIINVRTLNDFKTYANF